MLPPLQNREVGLPAPPSPPGPMSPLRQNRQVGSTAGSNLPPNLGHKDPPTPIHPAPASKSEPQPQHLPKDVEMDKVNEDGRSSDLSFPEPSNDEAPTEKAKGKAKQKGKKKVDPKVSNMAKRTRAARSGKRKVAKEPETPPSPKKPRGRAAKK
uniref:Uncharacterized protein n=1 Tax=Psilocybe cubensis TaxID=181762 RepID=A0A8H8CFU8_PSICU